MCKGIDFPGYSKPYIILLFQGFFLYGYAEVMNSGSSDSHDHDESVLIDGVIKQNPDVDFLENDPRLTVSRFGYRWNAKCS